ENQIQAITGATITSKAVTLGVNNAIDFYNSSLKGDKK
ncbi:MAG TPA: FMN-binding protein, partial [Clostridium sp.]